MRILSLETVKSNTDPQHEGRILTEKNEWLSPISLSGEEVFVPRPGQPVVSFENFYISIGGEEDE